jgi:hypothetical protein
MSSPCSAYGARKERRLQPFDIDVFGGFRYAQRFLPADQACFKKRHAILFVIGFRRSVNFFSEVLFDFFRRSAGSSLIDKAAAAASAGCRMNGIPLALRFAPWDF